MVEYCIDNRCRLDVRRNEDGWNAEAKAVEGELRRLVVRGNRRRWEFVVERAAVFVVHDDQQRVVPSR